MLTLNYLSFFTELDTGNITLIYQCPKCGECYTTQIIDKCVWCNTTNEELERANNKGVNNDY